MARNARAVKPTKGHNRKLMKMKQLSNATGINSATIRYYINQGLLPRPYKTHKNMAYYDEHYIDLINLIKQLQKEYFLPLGVIKEKINEIGHKKAPYMIQEIIDKVTQEKQVPPLSSTKAPKQKKALTREEVLEITNLPEEDFDIALEVGVIVADEQGLFDAENIEIAMLLSGIRNHLSPDKGFTNEFFIAHYKTLENLADNEINIFLQNIEEGDLSITDINSFAYKSFMLFYKLAPIIHRRLINKKIKESLNF